MKLRNLMIGICVAGATASVTAGDIMTIDAAGYLARGKDMYQTKNYAGAIDQLKQMRNLNAPSSLMEEADYYMAMSRYNAGDPEMVNVLAKRSEERRVGKEC